MKLEATKVRLADRSRSIRALWLTMAALAVALGSAAAQQLNDEGSPESVSAASSQGDGMAVTDAAVAVTTDRDTYPRGDPILVTITNGLPRSIFAPPRGGCSIVGVVRLQDGQWQQVEACIHLNVNVWGIPSLGALTRPLRGDVQASSHEVVVGGPVVPILSPEDVHQLSTVEPRRPGEPIPEFPEGAVAAPFSTLTSDLPPGTYRIDFQFGPRRATGDAVETVHSEAFLVTE